MKEFYIPSKGKGNLRCCLWEPEGEVRAVVQIVHGIGEHMPRYQNVAEVLNAQGYLVVGEDHMGHGGSVSDDTLQGYFYGGWETAVDDTYSLLCKTKAKYPGKPYFLYGHSMGSFMTRTLLYRYPDAGLSGALISGTGWQAAPVLAAGLTVCRIEAALHGDTYVSKTVKQLMFGSYTKGYENPRTSLDWLTRDEKIVDAYIADPLSGFDATVGLSMAMLQGMKMNEKPANLAKMPKDLPVFIFSGDDDPVGTNGKGVKQTYDAFRKAGMKNVSLKLYPKGRHEMHNELNKEEVFSDILEFLEAQL